MIRRMRFISNFVVENVRNGAVEADGKPARVKRNGISLAGCPKTSDGARVDLREARKRKTWRGRLAGRPRVRFAKNDARVKPAERFLNV